MQQTYTVLQIKCSRVRYFREEKYFDYKTSSNYHIVDDKGKSLYG